MRSPAAGARRGRERPVESRLLDEPGVGRLEVSQGTEIGRPSRLVAEVDGETVRVGGDTVIVAEGTVHFLDT